MPRISDKTLGWSAAALAVGIPFLLLVLIRDPSFFIAPDTMSYYRPGHEFWTSGRYVAPFGTTLQPEMGRTPLYPLFLGIFPMSATWQTVAVAIQVLLRTTIVALILTLPKQVDTRDWRPLAALLVALDLPSALASLQLLTETMSAFLLVLTWWLLMRWRERRAARDLVLSASVAGLAVLCRPINILVLPFLGVLLFLSEGKKHRFKYALAFLGMAMILPGAWMARNAFYAGRPILSITPTGSLLHYRAAGVLAYEEGVPLGDVQNRLRQAEARSIESESLTPWETARLRREEAWPIIRREPVLYLRQTTAGALRALFGPGGASWSDWAEAAHLPAPRLLARALAAASFLHLLLVYTLLVLGIRRIGRNLDAWWLVAVFLVLVLAAAGPEAYSRFRLPGMPYLILAVSQACFQQRNPIE